MRGPNVTEDLGAAAEPLPTMMPTGGPSTWSQGTRIYRGLWAGGERRQRDGRRGHEPRNRSSRTSTSRQSRTKNFQRRSIRVVGCAVPSREGAADTGADRTQFWFPRVQTGPNSKQAYCCVSFGRHLWWLEAMHGGFRVWRSMTVDVVAAAVRARRRDAMRPPRCDGARVAWLGCGDAPSD